MANSKIIIAACLTILCMLAATDSFAKSYSFTWSANPEAIDRYELHYKKLGEATAGTGATEGASPVNVGKNTSFTINGLDENATYYFALKAIKEKEESGFSRVIKLPLGPTTTSEPLPFAISTTRPNILAPRDFDPTTEAITQYGITWTFAQPVRYGLFITGDYWIVAPDEGVVVSSVLPAYSAGKNGSMINPIPGGNQGFDSGAYGFDSKLVASFPRTLNAGDAMLSSISRIATDKVDLGGRGLGNQHFLKTVAVLTVLASSPAPGSFRPSYCDRTQKLYNISQIKTSILPSLTPPVPPNTVSWYERHFERPWILFGLDFAGRAIHPYDNMPGYHRFVGKQLSDACMFLMTDSTNKTTTLRRFIQVGIDYYYTAGADSSTWTWPVIFTGLLLDERDIYDYWVNNPKKITLTREGEKIYYMDERNVTRKSTIIPDGQTWVDWKTKDGKYVAFAKQVGQEHEHLHPSEWSSEDQKNETYRASFDIDPWIGMHLSAILVDKRTSVDVREKFLRPQSLDYSDRWMQDGFTTKNYRQTNRTYLQEMESTNFSPLNSYESSGSPWIDAMWRSYR